MSISEYVDSVESTPTTTVGGLKRVPIDLAYGLARIGPCAEKFLADDAGDIFPSTALLKTKWYIDKILDALDSTYRAIEHLPRRDKTAIEVFKRAQIAPLFQTIRETIEQIYFTFQQCATDAATPR